MNSNISRPWGSEDIFVENKPVTVKILHIKNGEMFSLQYHNHRDEFWKVVKGNPTIFLGNEVIEAKENDTFSVSAGTHHRISASNGDVSVLEISTGEFDENDIVPLEDKYNRL